MILQKIVEKAQVPGFGLQLAGFDFLYDLHDPVVEMKEGYLADISLIYAMLSFLAVVLLTRVYMGTYLERKENERKAQKEAEAAAKEENSNA